MHDQREIKPGVDKSEFQRGLSDRHIRFMAIGGAIGSGLFLGSGEGIHRAGPSLLLAYTLCGIVVFFILRAMGELALVHPDFNSFDSYARNYLGDWAAFLTGWGYWLNQILAGIAEMTAIGIFLRFWFPMLPQWISAFAALLLLYAINLTAVKLFGELEFWLALGKVLTISFLIVTGLCVLIFHWGPAGATGAIGNLWQQGGFFGTGFLGFLGVLPITLMAFGGTEVIGLTAAEAADPKKTLPRAINSVVFRVLVFYVGSLGIIMALILWNQLDARRSPFVLAFDRMGLPAAAHLVNFVVLTAVISSCNTSIFATGRVLYSLAKKGQAPSFLATLNRRQLPAGGITGSVLILSLGILLNYLFPEKVFAYLMASVAPLLLWTWLIIIVCHLSFRRRREQSGFPMPGAPWTNYLVILFVLLVVILFLLSAEGRIALLTASCWFAGLTVIHLARKKRAARADQIAPDTAR